MGRSLWALRKLCPGLPARVRLLAVYMAIFVRGALGRSGAGKPRRVRFLLGGTERDWWIADAGELTSFWEIFVAGQYEDHLPERAELILDIGANIGVATAWLRTRYPSARIVAVEADPGAAQRLRRNVGADPGVEIVEAAVADSDGVAGFERHGMSVLGQMSEGEGSGTLQVATITLDSLLARRAPARSVDLMKLDVEGGEWRILAQGLDPVRTVVLEIHEPTPDGRPPDEVLAEIAGREGFEVRAGRWPGIRWLMRT